MNYLNTKPLLHGIRHHAVMSQVEIVEDYPARIADMLLQDEIDLGLVPVAITHRMEEWHVIGSHCIGCDGEVASVCIFSEVPLEEVKELLLDYQSRTSAMLAQVLLRDHWKLSPKIINAAGEDFRSTIQGTTAGLVIGDRALIQRQQSKYIYDLGTAWKEHTGLPFVFAAWISNKPLDEAFCREFDEANAEGLKKMDEIVQKMDFPAYDMKRYFSENIRFRLDERAREGMLAFLNKKL